MRGLVLAFVLLGSSWLRPAVALALEAPPEVDACAADDLTACADAYAWLHEHDAARARSIAAAQCDRHVQYGCAALGRILAEETNPVEVARGRSLLESSCAAGVAVGCRTLGFLAESGRAGVPIDLRRSIDLYTRGCELGDVDSCSWALDNLQTAEVRDPSLVHEGEALALLRRACALGSVLDCPRARALERASAAPPSEVVAARSHAETACSAGDVTQCDALGRFAFTGTGGSRDYPLAVASFVRACEGGVAIACYRLGRLYVDGTALPRSLGRARALFEHACATGSGVGCFEVAFFLSDDGPESERHAAFVRACVLGSVDGCRMAFADEYRSTRALTAATRAAARSACARGDAFLCVAMNLGRSDAPAEEVYRARAFMDAARQHPTDDDR